MMNKQKITRENLIFPLGLVIFQLTVFICNDLIQPAILSVIDYYHVDPEWAPYSMSLFLIGGAVSSAIIGPIADRYGRRPITLLGILYFILTNILIIFSKNIETFMLFRFLQGVALCFVAAVGFVAIQEFFDELNAIKIQALLSNISLLAPLAGPVLGALLISFAPWHTGFILIALVALGAFVLLYYKMPETLDTKTQKPSMKYLMTGYIKVSTHIPFLLLTLFLYVLTIPMLTWIALSPIFLVKDLGYSNLEYGIAQFPIFLSLIVGNLYLARIVDRYPLGKTIYFATPLVLICGVSMIIWTWIQPHTGLSYMVVQSLLCFAQGITFSVYYRLILMCLDYPRAIIAGTMSLLSNLVQAIGILALGYLYTNYGLTTFYYALGGLILVLALLFIPILHWVQHIKNQTESLKHL